MKINHALYPGFLTLLLSSFFLLISTKQSLASTSLFFDDFEDGDSQGWIQTNPWGGWSVSNGEYIGTAKLLQSPALPSYSINGSPQWQDYRLDTVVKSVKGIDKEILFRVNTNSNKAYIFNLRSSYFNGGNDAILAVRSPIGTENATVLSIVPFVNLKDTYYKFSAIVKNELPNVRIKILIDDIEIIDYLDNHNPILSGNIGLEVVPGGYLPNPIGLTTEIRYSYVSVSTLEDMLQVNNLKQYSVPWGTLEYDAAHIWSPGKDTISRFGCALTSTSMVLQYYGYSVTPDNLNIWLNNNNGYIPNGLIDWSSITKWVLLQHIINPLLPKLEYGRIVPFSNDSQNTELENNRPTLAKIVRPDGGTHFVVVVGKSDDTYLINDPATIQTFLSYYPSSYLNRIDTFTPSNTDLSYLYFYSSPNTVFSIYDQNGNLATGQQEVEGPYIDQVSQNNSPMLTWKTFVKAKPSPGSYVVRLKGNGDYRIISRLYDKVANLTEVKDTGKIAPSQVKTYLFKVGEINQTKIIDFQFIRDYLKEGLISGKIKNKVLYNALLQLLDDAEKVKNKVNGKSSKIIINSIKTTLKASSKLIEANYLTELMKYLGYLDESL